MATDDQLAVIRSWIGTTTTIPVDVDARLERLGTAEQVALELLRQRRADMLTKPTSLAVNGDVTVDWSKTLDGLDRLITALEQAIGPAAGGAATVTVSTIQRHPTRPRGCYRY